MVRAKVGVIGAGNVGGTCAQRILERDLADVALVDVVDGLAAGKALDLAEAAPVEGHDRQITGSTSYDILAGAQVVVITAGLARKPGMSRSDLLDANAKILASIVPQVKAHAPDAVLITVTNPLDIMTHLTWKLSGFPPARVVGMAGVLDAARFRYFIAQRLKVSVKEVSTIVLGGHGDSMVPLPRYTTVAGVPLPSLLPAEEVERLVQRTRDGGAEVVTLLKQGSAFYAPASSVADMAQAILRDERRLLPCCAYLTGQYGLKDLFCGVPVKLSARGVEEVVELELSDAERAALQRSASEVRKDVDALDAAARIPS
ncbi:MAG: malate dehydrogenase [Omnitrophica WOR_2 bacterium RIFCSPHIGHO2_02_FULL_68_15]|nr:MAG: malate dehydrogenase [Omnitrophica WOR_2 bacterium RIFCSPHIGHO2_02_FULL_68_15]